MSRSLELGLVTCLCCKAVCDDVIDVDPHAVCNRCGSTLVRRKPASVARTWAFLVTAVVLYLPANFLPVMHTRVLDKAGDSTIMGGVLEFWRAGEYGIAAIVFAASIAVPCAKFTALSFLLIATQYDLPVSKRACVRLYRCMESIGAWSMLDVLVVGWVAALSNFGSFSEAAPRIGIVFFGLVVVFTMLAFKSFDTRLIWDGRQP